MKKIIPVTVLLIVVLLAIIFAKNIREEDGKAPVSTVVNSSEVTPYNDPYIPPVVTLVEPKIQGDYYVISEWEVKYPATSSTEGFSYYFSDFSSIDSKYEVDSSVRFVTKEFDQGGGCSLGYISRYGKLPLIKDSVPNPEDLRKIDNFYYLFENEHQEPCFYPTQIISGDDAKLWENQKKAVREIFESLQ